MIQKNPFLKYMMKDKKEDVFHSSAYAKAQNGGNIGSASTESYQVRVNVNQARTKVKGYRDSEIMAGAKMNVPKAKTVDEIGKVSGGRFDRMNQDNNHGMGTKAGDPRVGYGRIAGGVSGNQRDGYGRVSGGVSGNQRTGFGRTGGNVANSNVVKKPIVINRRPGISLK